MIIHNKLPQRLRFYYGWYIVAIAFLAAAVDVGFLGYIFSLFIKPMGAELGWSRSELSIGATVGTIGSGLLGLVVGPLVDKYGSRIIMVVGGVALCAVYFGLASVTQLWVFIALYTIGRAIALSAEGGVATTTALANWFVKKRGRAMGLSSVGTNIGIIIMVPATQLVIDAFGWRAGWAWIGIIIWPVLIIPAGIFVRRRPEDLGLLPDGASTAADNLTTTSQEAATTTKPKVEVSWTRKEALRTRTFWLLLMAQEIISVTQTAVVFHIAAYYNDIGVPTTIAATAVSALGLGGFFSRIAWGFIVERVSVYYCMLAAAVGTIVAVTTLTLANGAVMAFVSAFLYGFWMGGLLTLGGIAWADYYGRQFQGAIRGTAWAFQAVGHGAGPLIAALVYDMTQSYRMAYATLDGALFISLALLFFTKPPKKRETDPGVETIPVKEAAI